MESLSSIPLVLPTRIRLIKSETTQQTIQELKDLGYSPKLKNFTLLDDEENDKKTSVLEFTTKSNQLGFVVNHHAKAFLDTITEPFSVLSITGPVGSGKSTLLNHMLNYVNPNETDGRSCFKVSNQTRCCTVGIWIWPKLLHWHGKRILVMDVEGLYGNDSLNGKTEEEQDYFMKLFTMVCSMSSVVLFNRSINVAVGMNECKEIEKLSSALGVIGNALLSGKPHFIYIARNYNELRTGEQDKNYWEKVLDQTKTSLQLRKFFNMEFTRNSFVTFVNLKPRNLVNHSDLGEIPLEQLNPDFIEKFKWFMNDHLPPKFQDLRIINNSEEIPVCGNFYEIIEKIVNGISQNDNNINMGDILNIAREGEAKKYLMEMTLEIVQKISEISLPNEWKNILDICEKLYIDYTDLSNQYLESCGFKTRCDITYWKSHSLIKEKFYLLEKKNNEIIDRIWKEKQEDYTKSVDLKNWKETKSNNSVIHNLLLDKMDQFLEKKEQESKNLENKILTELFLEILVKATGKKFGTDFPKNSDGCFSLISADQIDFYSLQTLLEFLKQPEKINKLKLGAHYSYNNVTLAPLQKKNDNFIEDFLMNIQNEIVQCIEKKMKSIYNKAAESILCPSIIQTFTYKDPYQPPHFLQFKKFLSQMIETNPNLNRYTTKKMMENNSAEFLRKYFSEVIPKKNVREFLEMIQTFVTDEIPSLEQQILVRVQPQYNKNWRLWFNISDFPILHEIQLDSGSENGDLIYHITLKSKNSARQALEGTPPKYIKLQKLKTFNVVITPPLNSERLGYIEKSLIEGVLISEPKYYDNFCLLTFGNEWEKLALLETQKEISFGETKYSFLDTFLWECTPQDIERFGDFVISSDIIHNSGKVMAEFWPLDSIRKTVTAPPSPSPSTSTSTSTPTSPSTSTSMSTSTSKLPLVISSEYLKENYKIQELCTHFKNSQMGIWDTPFFRETIRNFKHNERDGEAELTKIRILVAAGTMEVTKTGTMKIVPKHVRQAIENDPNLRYKSYELLNKEGKLKESQIVSLIGNEKIKTTKVILGPLPQSPPSKTTKVQIYHLDTLVCAEKILPSSGKILVLNMAHSKIPGGCWQLGKYSQEEEFFRRSNIHKSLVSSFYPISDEFGALCTKEVSVFRGPENDGYPFLENPFSIDVISLSAYNAKETPILSNVNQNNRPHLLKKYVGKTYQKILTLFHFAAQEGYQTLLLGALGCGAFNNPPEDVASLFHEVISQYTGWVPNVVFAILGKSNLTEFGNRIKKEYQMEYTNIPVPERLPWTCELLGKCPEVEGDHTNRIYHPPWCPQWKECPFKDDVIHSICARHPPRCQHGLKHVRQAHPCSRDDKHDRQAHPCSRDDIHDRQAHPCSRDDKHVFSSRQAHPSPRGSLVPQPVPTLSKASSQPAPTLPSLQPDLTSQLIKSSSLPPTPPPRHPISEVIDWITSSDKDKHTVGKSICRKDKQCYSCYCTSSKIKREKHMQKYFHSCVWGSACVNKDPIHHSIYVHQSPSQCTNSLCTLLHDPEHRRAFSHKGLWDFMLPCRNKDTCQLINCDQEKYFHPKI